VIDQSLGEQMRVTVIATGFDRQRHAEFEADRSIERPMAKLPDAEPQKSNVFDMDDDVLDIPRFLRDKD